MAKKLRAMRPWLRALVLVLVVVMPALASFTALSRYKTFTREPLLSTNLNAWQDATNTGINNIGVFVPSGATGDSIDIKNAAHDTLTAKDIAKIILKDPLLSLAAADSLKFHAGNFQRLNLDSLNTRGPVVSWPYDFSPGKRLRAAYANADTYSVRGTTSGTITVKGAAAAGTWTWTLPTSGGTTAYPLTTTDGVGTSGWNLLTVPGGGLGVATLASNGVLYGNGTGVVLVTSQGAANSILTANAGAPAFSASPTIGTSVTTPTLLSTANDAGAIGAAGTAFSDLFLASGSVINLNAGDITATHGSNILTWAGGSFVKTSQPSFMATLSIERTDVTGDGTNYTVVFNNEVYDQGANWDGTTFTAPVTGKYLFTAQAFYQGLSTAAGHTYIETRLTATSRSVVNQTRIIETAQLQAEPISAILDMTANDTCVMAILVAGGTKVVDLYGGATYVFLCGALLH